MIPLLRGWEGAFLKSQNNYKVNLSFPLYRPWRPLGL
jgi:hypothetical protein